MSNIETEDSKDGSMVFGASAGEIHMAGGWNHLEVSKLTCLVPGLE